MICHETIAEIIRFQFLRCENYAAAPEINYPKAEFARNYRTEIAQIPCKLMVPKNNSKANCVMQSLRYGTQHQLSKTRCCNITVLRQMGLDKKQNMRKQDMWRLTKLKRCFRGFPSRGCKFKVEKAQFAAWKKGPENRKIEVKLRPPSVPPPWSTLWPSHVFVYWNKGKDPHPQDKIQHLDFTKHPRRFTTRPLPVHFATKMSAIRPFPFLSKDEIGPY